MGNNEVVGPFGPSTVFGAQAPDLWLIRTALALRRFRTGQVIDDLCQRAVAASGGPKSWAGLRMFMENQIRQDDPKLQKVYNHFSRNLEDILKAGEAAGAKIILGTVAGNLKDCAPFASVPARPFDDQQRPAWKNHRAAGVELQAKGQMEAALARYEAAAEIDPTDAELQFRMGQCHLAQNQANHARPCFERALDLDALRVRADSRLNAIIAETAQRHAAQGVQLIDTVEILSRNAADGIPGEDFFYDHVHFTYVGNYLLARAIADAAAKVLPAPVTSSDTGSWAASELCAQRLGLAQWNRCQMLENLQRWLTVAPFTNQINHIDRQRRYREKLAALKLSLPPGALDQAIAAGQEALLAAPDDFYLNELLAKALHLRGNLDGAVNAMRQAARLLPQNPVAHYNLGLLLNTQGRLAEAAASFRQAVERRPDYAEAHAGLAKVLARQGNSGGAFSALLRSLELKPDDADALLSLGQLWQQKGEFTPALDCYRRAQELEPNSAFVHIHWGSLLAARGDRLEAAKHVADAVRLQPESALTYFVNATRSAPNDPEAHFRLANALAAQNRRSEALASLQRAVELKPDFWEARYLLGVEYAAESHLAEAQVQFSEVIRLRPGFTLAHLNLGVALAKEMKLADALRCFEEALRLEPANNLARQHLQTVQTILKAKSR